MADREKQSSSYNDSYDPVEEGAEDALQLPEHGGRTALIVGIVGGLVSALLPVIIVLLAQGLYAEAGRLGDKMPYSLAQTIFLLNCLGLLLNMAVAFGAGYITGRLVVRRGLGFYAGALVGAITYIVNTLMNWIPGYPARLPSSAGSAPVQTTTGVLIGSLILLVSLIVYALVGGLMGRTGAAAATNKHPYYEIGRGE